MTDNTTDDTTLAQRVDQLEARLDEALDYQQRVEQLVGQFANGQISRRAFLASMGAVGAGAYLMTGSARADPEWQNATGNSGTEQTPLANVYAQNAYHQSLDTVDATISNAPSLSSITDESDTQLFETDVSSGPLSTVEDVCKVTTGVSTTATRILTASSFVIVHGENESNSGDRFVDVVIDLPFGYPSVVAQNSKSGVPSRTYSRDGSDLELAMGSGSFTVIARATILRV